MTNVFINIITLIVLNIYINSVWNYKNEFLHLFINI